MNIHIRQATRAERRDYCCQIGDNLIVAVDDTNTVVGYLQYKDSTIYTIESFVQRVGVGRALIESVPQCQTVSFVCLFAHGFWEKMGFEPTDSRDWKKKEPS